MISNQRSVAILLSNNFEYEISNTKKDDFGNLLGVDIEIEGKTITLINIYGSNNHTPLFYNKVSESIEYFNNQSIILTGDYNLVQNQIWDIYIIMLVLITQKQKIKLWIWLKYIIEQIR